MKASGRQLGRALLRSVEIVRAKIDVVKLNMIFNMSTNRLGYPYQQVKISKLTQESSYMNMKSTKVLSELLLLLSTNIFEVLVSEDYNTSLGNKQGKFVFLDITELR